ncbi:MAG: hypothetical protein K6F68_08355 [Clostridiales bacterium]|nr:hypothetical protein [Clostridiales bacterium]
MQNFKCPVCGGKLNVKIGAEIAACEACGSISPVNEEDVRRFKAIYQKATVAMNKRTAAGYNEALNLLEPITFIKEASELSGQCRDKLKELEQTQLLRTAREKESNKRDTVAGIIFAVILLLVIAAIIAGAVYCVIRLIHGQLSPAAIGVIAGVVILIVIFALKGKRS